jgi:gliding motility-associated-like protein
MVFYLPLCILSSILVMGRNKVPVLDIISVQKDLQNSMEIEGKESLISESFIQKNAIIRSEIINGQAEIVGKDLMLNALKKNGNYHPTKKQLKKFLFLLISFWGINLQSTFAQYCIPQYGLNCSIPNQTNDFIDDFSISNAIVNFSNINTGCNGMPNNYRYYSNLTATAAAGCSFTFNIQSSTIYQQGFGIWIDWNNDNLFTGPGEYVWNSGVPPLNIFNFSGTVSVPGTVTPGTKRLRVRSNYNDSPLGPCAYQIYGECEDYNLEIVTPTLLAPTAQNDTICMGSQTTLTAVGNGVLQWFAGPAGGAILQTGANFTTPILNTTVTYYVQAVFGGCTSARTPLIVTVVPGFPLTLTASEDTVCSGSSTELYASAGDAFLWSPAASLNIANNDTVTATPTAQTTFNLIATNLQGCSVNASITIYIRPAPVPLINSSQPVYCEGDSSQLSASGGVDYFWTPSVGLSSDTIDNPICNASTTQTYQLVITDAAGCTSTANYTQTVNVLPLVNAGNDTTICLGTSAQLIATGGTIYLWSPGVTLSQSNINNPQASPIISTTYSVIVTDGNGCSQTDDVLINVNALPIANPGTDVSICPGFSTNLNGSGGTSYLWSPASGLNFANIQNPTATPASTAAYTLVVTDAAGCVSQPSAPITVTVFSQPPPPLVNVSGPITFCQGGNVTLTSSVATNNVWSTGATTSSIIVNSSGTYDVYYTDLNGCVSNSSASVTVTVNGPPASPPVTLSGPSTFCNGGSVTLTAPLGYTYLWNTGSNSQSITVSTSGLFSVTITDANGCSSTSANVPVTVNPNPSAPLISNSGPISFCQGDSVLLSGPAGFSAYSWNTGNSSSSISVNYAGSFSLVVSDANGCVSPISSVVNTIVFATPAAPVIIAAGPTSFCSGNTVTLSTSVPFNSYSWSNGAITSSITVNTSGSYSVSGIDANGCQAPSSIPFVVTVWPLPPSPQIIASGPTNFCLGSSVDLSTNQTSNIEWSTGQTTPTITVSTSGNYSATYTDLNGCESLASNPLLVNVVPLAPTPTISVSGPTTICEGDSVILTCSQAQTYLWSTGETSSSIVASTSSNYSVQVTDVCNPINPNANVQVTVNPDPVPDFTVDPQVVCLPSSVNFSNLLSGMNLVQWSLGDGGTGLGDNFSYSFQFPGKYDVSLTVTDLNGCTATITKVEFLSVLNKPEVSISISPRITELDENKIHIVNLTPDLQSFNWSISDQTITEGSEFYFYPEFEGVYPVYFSGLTKDGCMVEFKDSIKINDSNRFFSPNAFTPNGDQKNDVFKPILRGIDLDRFDLKIYDRWGGIIFSTNNPELGWDGGNYPQDNYVYKVISVKPDGTKKEFIGSVTLIR